MTSHCISWDRVYPRWDGIIPRAAEKI